MSQRAILDMSDDEDIGRHSLSRDRLHTPLADIEPVWMDPHRGRTPPRACEDMDTTGLSPPLLLTYDREDNRDSRPVHTRRDSVSRERRHINYDTPPAVQGDQRESPHSVRYDEGDLLRDRYRDLPTFALTPGNEPLTPRRTVTTSSGTGYTYHLASCLPCEPNKGSTSCQHYVIIHYFSHTLNSKFIQLSITLK